MKAKHFFNRLEHAELAAAIKRAEQGTSGDIVVFITHKEADDALAAAQGIFAKRHLDQAAKDDSLLIFVAPTSQTFALVGGQALHAKVGQEWWDDLARRLRTHFRSGYYTEGLIDAVKHAGKVLREHFPCADAKRTGQSDIVEE